MEIVEQYIVKYHKSENQDELAILFKTSNGNWFIKYSVWQLEDAFEEIAEEAALMLIN